MHGSSERFLRANNQKRKKIDKEGFFFWRKRWPKVYDFEPMFAVSIYSKAQWNYHKVGIVLSYATCRKAASAIKKRYKVGSFVIYERKVNHSNCIAHVASGTFIAHVWLRKWYKQKRHGWALGFFLIVAVATMVVVATTLATKRKQTQYTAYWEAPISFFNFIY